MSAPDPTAVAQFRYTVIAPLVTRTLTYGEQRALLRDLVARPWTDPTGRARLLHVRTVERWVAAYRAGGWDALRPVPRRDHGSVRALTPAVLAQALQLRAEDPHRSVRQVVRLLEVAGVVAPGAVAYSTLTRHFRAQGWEPPAGPRPADTFRRRQAPYANAEWQADTQLTWKLPDPHHPDRQRQVYLVAVIDDATRYLVGAQFFFQENRPRLEEVLKGAVVRYGVPEIFPCDNGAIDASAYLSRVCAELRIDLRHSAVRRPEGKGKIERFFRRVDQPFTHEARALIAQGDCTTWADLNTLWRAWVADGYHTVPHHGLAGQTPAAAWATSRTTHPPRTVDWARVHHAFLWTESRRVDKTGVIQLVGNRYEVASVLAGRTVVCRYDPFDLQAVHITYPGQDYPDAVPLVLRHHRHREVPAPEPADAAVPASGLNDAALLAARAATRAPGVRYGPGEEA